MNRLIAALLSVLIVLVAVHGFLVWRAGEQAQEDAERQACINRSQATAIIALMVPALVAPSDDRESQVESIRALSEQLDAC
jgi:hypothetical protein